MRHVVSEVLVEYSYYQGHKKASLSIMRTTSRPMVKAPGKSRSPSLSTSAAESYGA